MDIVDVQHRSFRYYQHYFYTLFKKNNINSTCATQNIVNNRNINVIFKLKHLSNNTLNSESDIFMNDKVFGTKFIILCN